MQNASVSIAVDQTQKFVVVIVRLGLHDETAFMWARQGGWHNDIVKEIRNSGFEILQVLGGGRIHVDSKSKAVFVWGESTRYGTFPKELTLTLLNNFFKGYSINNKEAPYEA